MEAGEAFQSCWQVCLNGGGGSCQGLKWDEHHKPEEWQSAVRERLK